MCSKFILNIKEKECTTTTNEMKKKKEEKKTKNLLGWEIMLCDNILEDYDVLYWIMTPGYGYSLYICIMGIYS